MEEYRVHINGNCILLVIMNSSSFTYSKKYYDDNYEYRQVIACSEIGKMIMEKGIMAEEQWRELGITMSRGWIHYTIYKPEPHVMLFRRPIGISSTFTRVSLLNNVNGK